MLGGRWGSKEPYRPFSFEVVWGIEVSMTLDESTPEAVVTRENVIEVLKTVEDPELFLDIWFLGLIYGIEIDGGKVTLEMTFTSPMCPVGPELKKEVTDKVAAIPGVTESIVNITFQPPWTASDEVKGMLGML